MSVEVGHFAGKSLTKPWEAHSWKPLWFSVQGKLWYNTVSFYGTAISDYTSGFLSGLWGKPQKSAPYYLTANTRWRLAFGPFGCCWVFLTTEILRQNEKVYSFPMGDHDFMKPAVFAPLSCTKPNGTNLFDCVTQFGIKWVQSVVFSEKQV